MTSLSVLCLALLACGEVAVQGEAIREIPHPLPHHPGNVFIAGEQVVIPLTASQSWQLVDYYDRVLRDVVPVGGKAALGRLSAGWYRLRNPVRSNDWVSLAVLEPLPRPTPTNSPIALDVAMSWFYPSNQMSDVASLCALAGVNWVRDRLLWREVEPQRGAFAEGTLYDTAARIQSEAGLRVLQVIHLSPSWAAKDMTRFPPDLRDIFNLYRTLASRWKGQVLAFEPWNEADIPAFGGHTGAEMANFQKAAYLGLKAGNPQVVACLNVWATHPRPQLEDFDDNQATAYFDTYNLHHYEPINRYPELYAEHRAHSGGKPIWVTEFAVPVNWTGDETLKEPSDADLRVQSERLVKAFAASLTENPAISFYFILPHFVEGERQFGIVRPDLTPRPAFVALAATARLLAEARPLGLVVTTNQAIHAYRFAAGLKEILIAWSDQPASLALREPRLVLDHFARRIESQNGDLALSSKPIFIVTDFSGPSEPPQVRPQSSPPSPLVLQPLLPADRVLLHRSAYRYSLQETQRLSFFAYNFGERVLTANIKATAPGGWKVEVRTPVVVPAGGRIEIPVLVNAHAVPRRVIEKLSIEADAGTGLTAIAAIRLVPDPNEITARTSWPVPSAASDSAWTTLISGNGMAKLTEAGGELICEAEPLGADRWFYPRLKLNPTNSAPPGAQGLAFTFRLLEGSGKFRALLEETNGSGYVLEWLAQPQLGQALEAMALFEDASFGESWSKPDPNGHFDPNQCATMQIGCNAESARVKFAISHVRWIGF